MIKNHEENLRRIFYPKSELQQKFEKKKYFWKKTIFVSLQFPFTLFFSTLNDQGRNSNPRPLPTNEKQLSHAHSKKAPMKDSTLLPFFYLIEITTR